MLRTSACYREAERLLKRLVRDETGSTAIEYTVIAALIGVVVLAGLGAVGDSLTDNIYGAITEAITEATGGGDEDTS
ncbi:Flp family type IVb pilin [Labrenzia sp. OB1]|uniref:Flp family type IVb pilin n=1 Tax=Labrenzia sp. OB1 TaxID=1561204 RepID=UPI000AFE99E4|nr:Flp family type IVb pilin [Labrenzia sp. OB1]